MKHKVAGFKLKRDKDERRIDQSIRMIENEDDTVPTRNDIGIHRLDAPEEESERDPERSKDQAKRERTAAVEN